MYTLYSNLDTVDTRDIIDRIDTLQSLIRGYINKADFLRYSDEYDELCTIRDEIDSSADSSCKDGITLIRHSHFEEHMDEIIADCYALPLLPSFMNVTVDYVAVMQDYSEVEINGATYYFR